MTVNIEGVNEQFVRKLPNLKALFRNTHVMINVTMTSKGSLEVTVKNWRTLNYEYEY